VPIFDPEADPGLAAPILLPLKGTNLKNTQLSEDGACIGRFRGEAGELEAGDCNPTTGNAAKDEYYPFKSGGDLEGYILVSDAENVQVKDLKATLCALLSGQTARGTCKDADGKLSFGSGAQPDLDTDGDGTNDAYALAAKIAGSSAKLNGACPLSPPRSTHVGPHRASLPRCGIADDGLRPMLPKNEGLRDASLRGPSWYREDAIPRAAPPGNDFFQTRLDLRPGDTSCDAGSLALFTRPSSPLLPAVAVEAAARAAAALRPCRKVFPRTNASTTRRTSESASRASSS
jgi:hypothetical protein